MCKESSIQKQYSGTMKNLGSHFVVGLIIRVFLILYGEIQDRLFNVPFTDIDYKVFSDAGKYVDLGLSPYSRHTYRYSPLISYISLLNIYIHPAFGKFIFSFADVGVSALTAVILCLDKSNPCYSLLYLYNPISAVICARGNSDSLSALLVLLTVYLLKDNKAVLCGVVHGLSVHLRLYPIVYSLPLYLSFSDKGPRYLFPTRSRLLFVFSFFVSFLSLTSLFYHLYGEEFLNESLLFHLKRVDIRHNYSVFFYLQYLSGGVGLEASLPLILLLFCLSIRYGRKEDLCLCLMAQCFCLVMYNKVLTCQYFIWFLCLLPLVLPRVKVSFRLATAVASMWLIAQLVWLIPAYLLEFRGKNTFLLIWIQGCVFFLTNVAALGTLLGGYSSTTQRIKSN